MFYVLYDFVVWLVEYVIECDGEFNNFEVRIKMFFCLRYVVD